MLSKRKTFVTNAQGAEDVTSIEYRREDLDNSQFAIPESRRYPIPDETSAKTAIAMVGAYGTETDKGLVRNAVATRFPDLNFTETEDTVLVNNKEQNAFHTERMTINVGAVGVRFEKLEGRTYMVCPMVMMTEGVHKGSAGSLYYPKEEMAKTPVVWDTKPIVVYHPTMNGQAISACRPEVISNRKIGMIMNTKWEGGKKGNPGRWTSEAWLEVERMKSVDKRVWNAVTKKQMMEVSTGLYTDNEKKVGMWGKEKYDAIARNYRPDHLAILPDEKGACSIADGAGLMRNAVSFDETRSQLQRLLEASQPKRDPKSPYVSSPWVSDVFDDFFIYSKQGQMFKQSYSIDDNENVSLSGSPVVVTRRTVYKTTTGQVLNTGDIPMDRNDQIDELVANADSPWEESDRKFLAGLTDDAFEKIEITANKNPAASTDQGDDDQDETVCDGAGQVKPKKGGSVPGKAKNAAGKGKMSKGAKGKSDNKDGQMQTSEEEDDDEKDVKRNSAFDSVEDYVANAPPGMRDVLSSMYRNEVNKREGLIESITANADNQFTEEFLETQNTEVLEGIAALADRPAPVANRRQMVRAGVPVLNYSGQGDGGAPRPVTNAGGVVKKKALPIPVMNFSMKKKGGDTRD